MRIALSMDSACDIPKELIEKYKIHVMPYFVILGDKEYADGEIGQEDLFAWVKSSGCLPKTAAIGSEKFKKYFEEILKDYDAVIHITLSWEMTSSGRNAVEGAKDMPQVHIVDSRSLSSGIGLLVLSCADKIEEGKDIDTILKELDDEKNRIQASFLVDTLKFLYKGGRCSAVSKFMASLLKIKPKILVSNGKMDVAKKYMGNINSCLLKYVEDTLAISNPIKKRAFVTHSSKMEISSKIVQILKDYGFENVYDCDASATISSHCGPNTLGILFMNK